MEHFQYIDGSDWWRPDDLKLCHPAIFHRRTAVRCDDDRGDLTPIAGRPLSTSDIAVAVVVSGGKSSNSGSAPTKASSPTSAPVTLSRETETNISPESRG